ncbi:MAG: hypothetical protein RLZZ507_840 [Cyanobacteriota bacterium]|jgi:hypothetical protein
MFLKKCQQDSLSQIGRKIGINKIIYSLFLCQFITKGGFLPDEIDIEFIADLIQ